MRCAVEGPDTSDPAGPGLEGRAGKGAAVRVTTRCTGAVAGKPVRLLSGADPAARTVSAEGPGPPSGGMPTGAPGEERRPEAGTGPDAAGTFRVTVRCTGAGAAAPGARTTPAGGNGAAAGPPIGPVPGGGAWSGAPNAEERRRAAGAADGAGGEGAAAGAEAVGAAEPGLVREATRWTGAAGADSGADDVVAGPLSANRAGALGSAAGVVRGAAGPSSRAVGVVRDAAGPELWSTGWLLRPAGPEPGAVGPPSSVPSGFLASGAPSPARDAVTLRCTGVPGSARSADRVAGARGPRPGPDVVRWMGAAAVPKTGARGDGRTGSPVRAVGLEGVADAVCGVAPGRGAGAWARWTGAEPVCAEGELSCTSGPEAGPEAGRCGSRVVPDVLGRVRDFCSDSTRCTGEALDSRRAPGSATGPGAPVRGCAEAASGAGVAGAASERVGEVAGLPGTASRSARADADA
ncbi:hypothetical protein GCM10010329_85680 [Streptomyces spiroverticillatus]|nr:hypothetical protein GCM10010329_85680 [Streptomyces spiroverticillatus]